MILFYIVLGLFLLGGYFVYRTSTDIKEFFRCLLPYTIFVGMLAVFVYAMISMFSYSFVQKTWVQDFNCKIISINSNSNVEGSFVLGTGYIKDIKYYYYRVQQEDGGIREYTAPVYTSTIYESDDTPRVERYRLEMDKKWSFVQNPQDIDAYKFYVPKGTVIKEFIIR